MHLPVCAVSRVFSRAKHRIPALQYHNLIFPIWVELGTNPSSKCRDYNKLRSPPPCLARQKFSHSSSLRPPIGRPNLTINDDSRLDHRYSERCLKRSFADTTSHNSRKSDNLRKCVSNWTCRIKVHRRRLIRQYVSSKKSPFAASAATRSG